MNNFVKMQERFVKRINNSKSANKMIHALMIEGSSKLLLERAVEYTIALLLCEHDVPCFECDVCQRVLAGNISDVIEFDLSDRSLKKENILEIQKRFAKTALESTNKQIYVIKYIEKANGSSLNALLKFLEEPNENVYAIFTTHNSSKVIDTIVSRSILFRLIHNDITTIKDVLYEDYKKEDVNLVSLITNDEVFIRDVLESEIFVTFKENVSVIFASIFNDYFFVLMYEMLGSLEKDDLRIFFELFYICITNMESLKLLDIDSELIKKFIANKNYDKVLDVALSARLQLDTNMNKSLLIDKFSIEMEGAML